MSAHELRHAGGNAGRNQHEFWKPKPIQHTFRKQIDIRTGETVQLSFAPARLRFCGSAVPSGR
jgi:hypothetical protein